MEKNEMPAEAIAPLKKAGVIEEKTEFDIDIIDPEPIEISIGDRKYILKPLPLKKIKLLYKFQELSGSLDDEKSLDKVAGLLAEMIGEPDSNFILENLNIPLLTKVFNAIMLLNTPRIKEKKTAV